MLYVIETDVSHYDFVAYYVIGDEADASALCAACVARRHVLVGTAMPIEWCGRMQSAGEYLREILWESYDRPEVPDLVLARLPLGDLDVLAADGEPGEVDPDILAVKEWFRSLRDRRRAMQG